MKKVIAVFFILLLMETVVFAQSPLFPASAPTSPAERKPIFNGYSSAHSPMGANNTCILGNANVRTYADQMDKLELTEQDSFLKHYRNEQERQMIPAYFRNETSPNYIGRDEVLCAMKRIPLITQNKKSCSTSSDNGKFISQTPCITDQMVDYIHWGLNETLKCYGTILDDFERQMIFKKINHESSFGFFFQYLGGSGIAQLIGESKSDLFLPGKAGNNFLKNHVRSNSLACESFVKLLSRVNTQKSLKSCEFISIGDGIGRSLMGGIGLYLHYRSDPQNVHSAENLLNYWGYKKSNTVQYKKIRSYITLGMYNKGPWGIIKPYRPKIAKGALSNKSDTQAFNTIMNIIKKSNFYPYIQSVETSPKRIYDQSGNCKF